MEARKTVRGRGKSTDFAFNFYIVDSEDSFWREKNARLGREFIFSTPFS